MLSKWSLVALVSAALMAGALSALAANPKEAEGYRGTISGTVKSAQADGLSFVLTVTQPAADQADAAKATPLVGKVLTIGVRTPVDKDRKPYNHPDDVAYIKTLKPGMEIVVSIFSVRSNPNVLRLQAPGTPATRPASTQPAN